ncbi:hypothetical protein D0T84_12180 [Dysgonomonas sp. 521]|uniref:hypothetical protein n=1 Tax=Dysgonomonas sp. 521 TaxID=2302932 RepID=UPI0013D304DC|nr:hypothetical protein [Dysgonomonas sp. 521]NDV95665.1 hypothetical protein [Dysgonomonas sp. 521]
MTTQVQPRYTRTSGKFVVIRTFTIIAFFALHGTFFGQVSIGTTEAPDKALLLQLKTQEPDADNVTSTKGGLVLPRVRLVDKTTLEPFIANDIDFQNNVDNVKGLHTGLMVYNVYSSAEVTPSPSDPNKIFQQGTHVWDGTRWKRMGLGLQQALFFYPPSFNLPLPAIDADTDPVRSFDLYEAYENQFNKTNTVTVENYTGDQWITNTEYTAPRVPSPTGDRLYTRDELDYVITYYDVNIIYDVSINTQGVMSYRVKDNDPGPTSFLNLVFVVKQ